MILLTGSTGNTGGQVAAQLSRAGVPFKVLVRSERNRERAVALGYDTVLGDFDHPESLAAALRGGIESAYLVCTPDEKMLTRERNFIDAARKAGVRRVVKTGAILTDLASPSTNLRLHAQIERHLAASGMEYTCIRPHGFMQTFVLFSLDFVRKAGAYIQAAGDGGMPLVDVRDVAKVAVMALTEDGHAGKTYEVTGPENLTFAQQARILGEAFKRPVTYIPGSDRVQRLAMKAMGVCAQSVEHVDIVMRWCREHKLGEPKDTLARLGITPTHFADFARDLAEGRTGGGNSFEPPQSPMIDAMNRAMIWMLRARFAVLGRPN